MVRYTYTPQPTLILPPPAKRANGALLRSNLTRLHSWFGLRPPNIRRAPSEFIPDEKYSNKKTPRLPKILSNIKEKLFNLHTIQKLLV